MASIIPESASSRRDPQNIPIENHPDPYGIAYLRGGIQELLKLHLFELVQKGNLAVAEEKHWYGTKRWLVAVADTPDRHYLSPLEQSLLALYKVRRSPKDIFKLVFPGELVDACRQYRQAFKESGLLTGRLGAEDDAYDLIQPWYWVIPAFIVIGALNYFLHAGISIFISIFNVVVCLTILFGLVSFLFVYRPTKQGRQLLKRLKAQFAVYAKYDAATWALTPLPLAAIAVLGTGILAGSPAADLADILEGKSSHGFEIEVER